MLRIQDISQDKLFKDWGYTDVADNNFRKFQLRKNDIIVARTGATVGVNKFIGSDLPSVFNNGLIRLRVKPELCDAKYLYYCLRTDTYSGFIENISAGTSTQPNIQINALLTLEILLPQLPEQKAIAEVLSCLDDKIDLLHKQNKTLESLAETLFRQYFIEAAQDDWEVVKVGDIAKTNVSTIKAGYNLNEIKYLDTGSITEGKMEALQVMPLSSAPSRAKRLVAHNDIIISTVRPNHKHYGFIKEPPEDLVVSTGFCVITCTKIDPHFMYLFLTQPDMTDYLSMVAEASTSTYPSLKPSDIEAIEFNLPPQDLLLEFSNLASESWEKIEANYRQIQKLETLRDTLLPKLMNGDVWVEV